MAEIPAPVLSRHLGVIVVTLSVVSAIVLVTLPPLGFWPFAVALVVAAIHLAFVALAVLIVGRSGLAGRHGLAPALGAAAALLLGALVEVVVVFVVGLAPDARPAWFPVVAGALAALAGLLIAIVGIAVLRAAIVRPGARILPLLGGLALLVAAVAVTLDPVTAGRIALAVAALLLAGVGFALFTPRTVK